MKFNDQNDEQSKQYKEFIDKIKDDMVNTTGIPVSIFENTDPNSTGFGGKYNMGNNPCVNCPFNAYKKK